MSIVRRFAISCLLHSKITTLLRLLLLKCLRRWEEKVTINIQHVVYCCDGGKTLITSKIGSLRLSSCVPSLPPIRFSISLVTVKSHVEYFRSVAAECGVITALTPLLASTRDVRLQALRAVGNLCFDNGKQLHVHCVSNPHLVSLFCRQ